MQQQKGTNTRSVANTVDIDKKEDYMSFMQKADKDNNGLTQDELSAAIAAVSEQKDSYMMFDKAKLNEFLGKNNMP